MTSAVLLDVGGVMLLPHHEPVAAALRGIQADMGAETIARAHYLGVAAIDRDPPNRRPGFMEAFVAGMRIRPEDRARAIRQLELLWARPAIDLWRQVIDGTTDGLMALAKRGLRLGVISNADGTVEQQLRLHELCQVGDGAGVAVEVIADSFVVGHAKPSPEIFHFALDAMRLVPNETLYVGDSVWSDVEGAESVGVKGLHFDPQRLCASDDHPHASSLMEVADFAG